MDTPMKLNTVLVPSLVGILPTQVRRENRPSKRVFHIRQIVGHEHGIGVKHGGYISDHLCYQISTAGQERKQPFKASICKGCAQTVQPCSQTREVKKR